MMSYGDDPFANIGNPFMMSLQQTTPAPAGHICSADCVRLPADFPILEK